MMERWQAIGEMFEAWWFAVGMGRRRMTVEMNEGRGLSVTLRVFVDRSDQRFQNNRVVETDDLLSVKYPPSVYGQEIGAKMRREFEVKLGSLPQGSG